MREPNKAGIGKRIWDWIGAFGNLQTLWQLAVSFGVASKVMSRLPGGWHPPQYWVTGGFVFFGTWATAAFLPNGVKTLIPKVKRWKSPHKVAIKATGGRMALVTLTHSGEPATWSVDAKIIRTLGGEPNPSPQIFDCRLHREHGISRSINLRANEWAYVILATIESSQWHDGSWLDIGERFNVDDSGVEIEIIISGNPQMKTGPLTQRFQIQRIGGNHLEVKPI